MTSTTPSSFSYRLHGHTERLHRILHYQGSPLFAVEGLCSLPDPCAGSDGPLALRTRQHDNVGLTSQPGKHTRGVLLPQHPEDDP